MTADHSILAHRLESANSVGVLACNLGTPAAPTADAVRAYLREFLTDPMVVQPPPPRWVWRLILETMILPSRPARSAEKYKAIWTPEGSPLLLNSRRIAAALEHKLINEIGSPLSVELAMRYGEPSIDRALDALEARGCGWLVVLPLFPQVSSATTGSIFEAVNNSLKGRNWHPEVIRIHGYDRATLYTGAVAKSLREHWDAHGRPEHLLVSFHGMPRRYADAEGYLKQCRENTASLMLLTLDEGLRENPPKVHMCFQSRFGREEWLKPYTFDELRALGQSGAKRIDVISPGFAADCLETLHELAIEGRDLFQSSGGGEYHYIRTLNDRPDHIAALAEVVKKAMERCWGGCWKIPR